MRLSLSSSYLVLTGALLLLLVAAALHASFAARALLPGVSLMNWQVRTLELTDLTLFSEASYTRNLALADRFTPFQDSPMALEHFPSGSVAGPPAQLRRP
ncbi:hypothetical protein KP001_02180 [Geomonas subterranea]|uniref:Uncharacterized protein n=1 Tax=Geomonas subterranea TaxID=2847989 RepID=A0ABX8LM24_9BACT|nr:hypothetical protein [Geomonas subterranea]QXE91374.1 hypothetical protein KP001_02180 [Geomonas subterranea]QXM10539.1 hypothetical protein KP002_05315 [Geomonas subterranea]